MLNPFVESVRDQLHGIAIDPSTPPSVAEWAAAQRDVLNHSGNMPVGFNKGDPLPRSLGELADAYAEVRSLRLAKQKEVDAVKERETELFKYGLATLEESPDTGASGRFYRIQQTTKTILNVTDWPAFYNFLQQTGAFEMMQRRLGEKAVKEYMDEKGALPPGVEQKDLDTLSFTKI